MMLSVRSKACTKMTAPLAFILLAGAANSLLAANSTSLSGAFAVTATITSSPGTGAAVAAEATYNADGNLTASTTALNLLGVFFPFGTASTTAHGGWINTAPGVFSTTFQSMLSARGTFLGYLRNRETVKLDPSGTSYTGTWIIEFIAPGQPALPLGGGTLVGTQIVVIPLTQ
jgi:hypothetical protein